jgi:hypothetical protein
MFYLVVFIIILGLSDLLITNKRFPKVLGKSLTTNGWSNIKRKWQMANFLNNA